MSELSNSGMSQAAGGKSGAPDAPPAPNDAERARTLLEHSADRVGTLCTLARRPPGHPYGSLVPYAMNDGSPLLLLSSLAEHTRNLAADARCSLLVAEPGAGDVLARGRVTVTGSAEQLERGSAAASAARAAYLAAHPEAERYIGFRDFDLWRLTVQAARYIAGFGRMSWIDSARWIEAAPDPIAPHAASIVEHMNEDHAETLALYSRSLARIDDTQAAVMTGVDCYGFEMLVTTRDGARPVRLGFSHAIRTPDEARRELVALARRARSD